MRWYLKDNSILNIINYGIRKLKIMECPFCGEEMKNGFVRSGGATHPARGFLYWNDDVNKATIQMNSGDIVHIISSINDYE